MYPLWIIQQYKTTFHLHPTKSKLLSLSLKPVYSYMTGTQLDGAQSSLNDVKAQTTIVSSQNFIDDVDKINSMTSFDVILFNHAQSEMKEMMEPALSEYSWWRELNDNDSCIIWFPRMNDQ